MGRVGVTLLDVEKAVIQLQGRGKNPIVDAIRELLGTGSKSTIIQHLKACKSKNDESQGKLPQELLALVTGLWERLNGQAEQRIIEIENSSEQQLLELKYQLLQAQRDNTDLKTKLYQFEESLSEECQSKAEFEKQTAILADQRDRLQKYLSEADNKIETLRHEKLFLTQEKSQLDGYLEQLQQTA